MYKLSPRIKHILTVDSTKWPFTVLYMSLKNVLHKTYLFMITYKELGILRLKWFNSRPRYIKVGETYENFRITDGLKYIESEKKKFE